MCGGGGGREFKFNFLGGEISKRETRRNLSTRSQRIRRLYLGAAHRASFFCLFFSSAAGAYIVSLRRRDRKLACAGILLIGESRARVAVASARPVLNDSPCGVFLLRAICCGRSHCLMRFPRSASRIMRVRRLLSVSSAEECCKERRAFVVGASRLGLLYAVCTFSAPPPSQFDPELIS